MYRDALEVQPTFNSIFQQIATDSNAKFTAAPIKHLSRALEKTSMKPANDVNLDRADNVCDVRRGMLVYSNFGDMVRGIEATVAHLDIVILRTKDRYSSPTSGGWMDLVMNIKFKSDNNAHVSEIQFIHEGLLSVRKTCGGHTAYNKFRSALEMLEVHGALEDAKRVSTVDAAPIVLWLGQNGVKVNNDLTPVLTELNVSSVLDLASLKQPGVQKILNTMNKLQCKKWTKHDVPSKLASCLSASIVEATSKTSVVEWLAALSLSESGAAEWLDTNGPYEEMVDVKDLIQEEDDKQQLIAATKGKSGVHAAARVERALAALLVPGCKLKLHGCGTRMVIGGVGAYANFECNGCSKTKSGERWFCAEHQTDYCFDCHSSGKEKAAREKAAKEAEAKKKAAPKCPSGHPLKIYVTSGGSCDGCRTSQSAGTTVMDCRRCNYWLCSDCCAVSNVNQSF
jgi:hypothetical protein